ncbi:Uncharacterised protein [uncultured archaeon]|nr:Uncharacterised protein [uncultured archaeon]
METKIARTLIAKKDNKPIRAAALEKYKLQADRSTKEGRLCNRGNAVFEGARRTAEAELSHDMESVRKLAIDKLASFGSLKSYKELLGKLDSEIDRKMRLRMLNAAAFIASDYPVCTYSPCKELHEGLRIARPIYRASRRDAEMAYAAGLAVVFSSKSPEDLMRLTNTIRRGYLNAPRETKKAYAELIGLPGSMNGTLPQYSEGRLAYAKRL